MVAGSGRRLSRDERRAQLVARGREEVERHSFDGLSTDRVAEAAGISRGLLFHYFPTRDDFLVAIAADAADELLGLLELTPTDPPLVQLRRSLDAFVDFVTANRDTYLALIRGAAGGKVGMLEIFDRTRGAIAGRVLEGLALADAPQTRLRYVARGYVAFVEEVIVAWLRDPGDVARHELVATLESSLVALLGAAGVPLEAVLAGADEE